MIVADTSYLVEAILRDASLLEDETILAPDLVPYEIMNTLWKHETLLGDLKNSFSRIDVFVGLVLAGTIQLVRPDERLLKGAYALSIKHRVPVYDTIFVAMALQLDLELKTFDDRQSRMLSKERGKR